MKVATPYGAFELKKAYQANLGRAVLIAGLLNLLFVTSFMILAPVKSEKPKPAVKPLFYDKMAPQPPPTIAERLTPEKVQGTKPRAWLPPSTGVPSVVPDNLVRDEKFATQDEIRAGLRNQGSSSGDHYGFGSPIDHTIEEYIPPMDSFVPYDVAPVMVKEVKSTYPELARRSAVEGRVYIQAWIDRCGKVKEAKCLKEGSINLDIFCESALQAARQNEYKPAISNNVPVACWVTYKVDFVLR